MRILDEVTDEATNRLVIILTVSKAGELRDGLKSLLSRNVKGDHVHISDQEYKKEITVSLYDRNILHTFSQRFQKLRLEDK